MQLSIDQATELAIQPLTRYGLSIQHARMVAEHLVEAALCGHEFSSLPRMLAIVEELRNKGPASEIRITREDGCFAHVDGGDNIGYVVSLTAVDKAIEICRRTGVAVVTANNTWFSGRCAFYVQRAALQGFVAMHTTNTTARVAPFGGTERLMGTNPFAIAFPSDDDPVVIDIGTSAITWGDVVLMRAKGEALPAGVAVDTNGRITLDPTAALEGAFMPWGEQRGSALAIAVQLLGVLAGSRVLIEDTSNYGLFFVVIDPDRIAPGGQFKAQVSAMRKTIDANRPLANVEHVRVPGDGSQGRRKRAVQSGMITLDDKVYARIQALSA
jgi:LDH2 family malate/lactate/ureidoglycolate dehydrogenase